jgi:molybdopterin-guanine dinucleotide biosynthesis protein B
MQRPAIFAGRFAFQTYIKPYRRRPSHSAVIARESGRSSNHQPGHWMPAFAGMTVSGEHDTECMVANGPAITLSMRIIGLAGWSGSGKTTLITKVVPRLIARGCRVSTLKHAHHGFDLDQPGKDSFVHRAAGATEVVISSAKRFAILHELREEPEWDLPDLLKKLSPVDLVLVEGYKRDAFPKLEVHRVENGKPLLQPEDPHIVAIASDRPLPEAKVPVIDLDDVEGICDLLVKHASPVGVAAAALRSA